MERLGASPPRVTAPVPGAKGQAWIDVLAARECPGLTARRARRRETSGASGDPLVWTRAAGANVVDADGNIYVDLTTGFGAALAGHGHPRIVKAATAQTERLIHALGDVHPSDVKVELLERLAELSGMPDARVMLATNGADAVEAALQTAVLATGRTGVIAFDGGYHGLSLGALAVCGYGHGFRAPFKGLLPEKVRFAPYPRTEVELPPALAALDAQWGDDVAAVVVEPWLGRGGVIEPAQGFLEALRARASERGTLLVIDEILTGLGRTGARFAHTEPGVAPDILCLGKALGGGFPIAATIAPAAVMEGWARSSGEALRTGTFYGHPVAAAAALAFLDVLEGESLAERARALSTSFRRELDAAIGDHPKVRSVAGQGALLGVEFAEDGLALRVVQDLMERGYLTLPAGPTARTLELLPPANFPEELLRGFVSCLVEVLAALPNTAPTDARGTGSEGA
ncbi:MAG: aspartate aminotransferase family protein [Polyangiales bacterium]|nr:aspartate aminotransferase family protein [Myxococcales bacterium]